ncbi:hypothetical protein ACWCQE_27620 [Streptomyces sp. NPDC002409]|uniref:hypothetical protein n=1 Tax=Streptomyces misionensis TaxID=67331 RepID=UPI003683293C
MTTTTTDAPTGDRCPGFEKEHQGISDAKRRLANCKHCGQPRTAHTAAEDLRPAGLDALLDYVSANLPDEVPLIVSRYDVAMEPAIEEDPVLTIGAIADDGRPVALLLDLENRTKVGRWITPATDGTEAYAGELAMLRGLVATIRATATHGSDMDEVRRLLAEHAADEQDAYTGGTK